MRGSAKQRRSDIAGYSRETLDLSRLLSGEEMTAHESFSAHSAVGLLSDHFIRSFLYAVARAFKKVAVLTKLLAMTPSPTQRAVPSAP